MALLCTAAALLCLQSPSPLPNPADRTAQHGAEQLSVQASCRLAFEALQTKDVSLLERSFPTAEEIDSMVMSQVQADSPAAREAAREAFEEQGGAAAILERMSKRMGDQLETAHQETKELFALKDATFLFAQPAPPAKALGPWNVAPVEFYAWADGAMWSFGALDVLQTSRGWAFTEFLSFKGKRDIVEPAAKDGPESEDGDVFRKMDQERIFELKNELAETRARLEGRVSEQRAEIDRLQFELTKKEQQLLAGPASGNDEVERIKAEAAAERAAADEAMAALRTQLRSEELDNIGRSLAVDRLEAKLADLETPVPAGEEEPLAVMDWDSVEWWDRTEGLPEGEEPAPPAWHLDIARRLDEPLSIELEDITHSEALRVISLATSVSIYALPDAFDSVDEPLISLKAEGEPAHQVLEGVLLSTDSTAGIFDRHVLVASGSTLNLFQAIGLGDEAQAPAHATDLERKLRAERHTFDLSPDTAAAILELIVSAAETNLWIMQDMPRGEAVVEHSFVCPTEFSLWTLAWFIALDARVTIEAHEDVLQVSGDPFSPPSLPFLGTPDMGRIDGIELTGEYAPMPLKDLLARISDETGVTLEATDEVLAMPKAANFHGFTAKSLSLTSVMQLIAVDLDGETEWSSSIMGALLSTP